MNKLTLQVKYEMLMAFILGLLANSYAWFIFVILLYDFILHKYKMMYKMKLVEIFVLNLMINLIINCKGKNPTRIMFCQHHYLIYVYWMYEEIRILLFTFVVSFFVCLYFRAQQNWTSIWNPLCHTRRGWHLLLWSSNQVKLNFYLFIV